MKTYTLTENKKLSLKNLVSIKTHSDLSIFVETVDANYFAGMALFDGDDGTFELTPVMSIEINDDDESEFEDLLP